MQKFTFLCCFSLLLSCSSVPFEVEENPAFYTQIENFLAEFWKVHTAMASQLGLSEYDSILEIPNPENFQAKQDFYKKILKEFEAVNEDEISISQRTDLKLITNELKSSIWNYEVLKSHEWNPARYNMGSDISGVLEKEKRALEDRLKDISKKLALSKEYYQAAQNNIKQATQEHLNLAIKQIEGFHKYLNSQVKAAVKKSKLKTQEKKEFNRNLDSTLQASKKYVSYLRGLLSNPQKMGGFKSFRLGEDLYKQKFEFDLQIESSPEKLYKEALSAQEDIRSKMFELSIELYPKFFGEKLPPKDRQTVMNQVIQKVSQKHTKPEKFVETVRQQIPQLTAFIIKKDLLTLDPNKPLKVRETPTYQRGFAGASVDSPGPFDRERETFYNVTPLDGMSRSQQNSYLREYNDYTLQILNIHEAVPGHYVQLVYSNQSPSLIKSIFGNGTMVEGWAVYTERMMLEEGYGDNSPELWLMYYKWFLRVVTNTILDYEVHNKNLSKADAMKLMTEMAFQEKAEADGKWNRATVSQVQLLSYFAGFNEIYSLREALKKKKAQEEKPFNLKEFHETFLSFGSAPVKEIKKLMLQ